MKIVIYISNIKWCCLTHLKAVVDLKFPVLIFED